MNSVCMLPLGRNRAENTHQLTVQGFSLDRTSRDFKHKQKPE